MERSRQISWLLNHVKQGDTKRQDGFFTALEKTNQGHVVEEIRRAVQSIQSDASIQDSVDQSRSDFSVIKL